MNTYSTEFFAECPSNNVRVKYALTIRTGEAIRVEHILKTVAMLQSGYHEDFADRLHRELGGSQTLVADHHGVRIETLRPMVAHWYDGK